MGKTHRPKGLRISDEVHRALRVRAAETGESMGQIAERALRRELGMMARIDLDEMRTTYQSDGGTEHEAIQLPWHVVRSILGRNHDGSAEDDARLIEALREIGAPEWIEDAEGWTDEHGWGLIGPRASVDVTNPWTGVRVSVTRDDVTPERLEALAVLMPDEVREELHREHLDDPFAFWAAYVDRVGSDEAGKIWFS